MIASKVLELLHPNEIECCLRDFIKKVSIVWSHKEKPYGHEKLYETYLAEKLMKFGSSVGWELVITDSLVDYVKENPVYKENLGIFKPSDESVKYYQPDFSFMSDNEIKAVLEIKTANEISFSHAEGDVVRLKKIKSSEFNTIECVILLVTKSTLSEEGLVASLKGASTKFFEALGSDKNKPQVQAIHDDYFAVIYEIT